MSKLVSKYYHKNPTNILLPLIWGGSEEYNNDIFEDLGLSYENYMAIITKQEHQTYHFSNFQYKLIKNKRNDIFYFIDSNPDLINNLVSLYKSHVMS